VTSGGNMRKAAFILTILMLIVPSLAADEPCQLRKVSLTLGAGIKSLTDDLFKEVYDTNNITYSLDVGVIIIDTLELFLHSDYFKINGQLTYTKEKTTLKIIPLEIGARYLIKMTRSCKLMIFPYIGAGSGLYLIEENNPIGTFEKNKFGFFAEGGIRFYIGNRFFIDSKIKYIYLNVPSDIGENIQMGGLSYTGGIGIAF
jgi:hypothetical protein